MKKTFYSELAYVLGILALALGTAFLTKADFGISMVVAPAYLLHLKLSETLPFFSFGMAEYVFQGTLILLLIVVLRKFRLYFLFSFFTAVYYGVSLDLMIGLVEPLMWGGMIARLVYFALGVLGCCIGVALVFHTYIAPEAYELVVKELSSKYHKDINKCKTIYDCTSCITAIIMSFAFYGFGHFEGIGWGSIFCALMNGTIIGWLSKKLEKIFTFSDGLKLRKWFE